MKVLWKYCNNISQFLFLILYFIFPLFLCFLFFIHISFFFFFSPLFFSSTHVLFSFLFFFFPSFPFFPYHFLQNILISAKLSFFFFIFLLPFSLFSYHFVYKFLSLYPIKAHKLKGHTHHTIWFSSNEDRWGNRQGRNGSDWCLISTFTAICLPQHASIFC